LSGRADGKWVFCCGMQRSGSTLQFQIAARLVEDAGLGRRVEWVEPRRFPELRAKYASQDGFKVFKNHVCTDEMAAEFARGDAVGIYSYRDVRDVFVSNMSKYSSRFDQFWYAGFLETTLQNYQRWTGLPRVLVSRYESMVQDLPGEVRRIASHLGLAVDAEACRRIADEYSMEKQKERIERFSKGGALVDGYAGARYDPESMLHTDHIQGGRVGGWQGKLSDREVALLESAAGDWLREHGYALSVPAPRRMAYALWDTASRAARKLLARLRLSQAPSAS
jgi:hypothetical protein